MGKYSSRRTIFRASPDDGTDYTSFVTVEFIAFICFRIFYLLDLLEYSIVVISIYGVSVHARQASLRSRDQHIPCCL